MRAVKAILCIIAGLAAAGGAAALALIHEVGEYIKDIYDDDMYWGGKE